MGFVNDISDTYNDPIIKKLFENKIKKIVKRCASLHQVSAMDTIIDNVLLTYVSYGRVLASGKPEVLRAVSTTFSEKEVADARDVLWTQCIDDLEETPIEILPV